VSRYCNQIHINAPPSTTSEDSTEPSIYHTLLSLYLTPPPPHAPNWPPALSLLSKHGARLPASSTLDLVPASLPVRDLESYFRGRIRNANSVLNSERIAAQLRGVEKVAVEAAVLLGEDGPKTKVDEMGRRDRHCAVCHKRFGQAAIRVWPDNSVVHSGCMRGSIGRGAKERERVW
jgi:hypothetical protein